MNFLFCSKERIADTMTRDVDIYVTHYVRKDIIELNDALVEEVQYLEHITKYPHTTTVIYYDEGGAVDELYDRLPRNIRLVGNDRQPRSDIQPSLRNKVIDLARESSYFILLHNDIRVTVGWLDNLVSDMAKAENIYGKDNVIMNLRFIPYHLIGTNGSRSENGNFVSKYPIFWDKVKNMANVFDIVQMNDWCRQWNFKFDGVNVHSPGTTYFTDDGHALMMYMGTKKYFQDVGLFDEDFIGKDFDDNDMGIRALVEGKKNLKCQGCLVGHIEGLSFKNPNIAPNISNDKIFIKKWGRDIFDEMQTGKLWIRLHKMQDKHSNTSMS